jgi:hypothetical protein
MRIKIKIITTSGNNNKAARGTDTFEFPFNRIRLLKKANVGKNRSFCLPTSSSEDMCDGEGIGFIKFWTNPIDAANASTGWGANYKELQARL